MEKIKLSHCELAYRVWGEGSDTLVIQTALNSCCAEWWHIAEDLGKHFRVIVFDRAGYGESSSSSEPRTPENISLELSELLDKLDVRTPVILLGHSQGGLYCADFALRNPKRIRALILLDPLTPYDHEFKDVLSKGDYKRSGIDKLPNMKMGKIIAGLGLGFLFKPLLKKSPPFYYHEFPDDTAMYMLESLTRKRSYHTAIQEYLLACRPENSQLVDRGIRKSPLDIPLVLILHSSEIYIKEMMQYTRLDEKTSKIIEDKWQEIMRRYMHFSKRARLVEAPQSGHFIHLTDYALLKETIMKI